MRRLIKWLVTLLVIGWVASFVAALLAKRRLIPMGDEQSDEVGLVAVFAPLEFESSATSFRGGTVDCWFGGGEIDLRGATLDPDGALLEVHCLFGGGTLLVPDDWRVTVMARGVGGIRDVRATAGAADGPELVLDGWFIMGGFAVESEPPETGRWADRTEGGPIVTPEV